MELRELKTQVEISLKPLREVIETKIADDDTRILTAMALRNAAQDLAALNYNLASELQETKTKLNIITKLDKSVLIRRKATSGVMFISVILAFISGALGFSPEFVQGSLIVAGLLAIQDSIVAYSMKGN